jgi:hypothetical protein
MLRTLSLAAIAAFTAGCFSPPTASQRLADSAIDMNIALQLGRMDIAMDYIGKTARASFTREHAGWGKRVRVVDTEFGGIQSKEKDEADVVVDVSWQTLNDPTLRETHITQHWRDTRGTWSMVSETCEGDAGLLLKDEDKDAKDAKEPKPISLEPKRETSDRFETRVISAD